MINVGSGEEVTIKKLANLVKDVIEKKYPNKSPIKISTTSSDDNRSYHINSSKIKRSLGFEPKYSVEDAVRGLCAAFKQGKLGSDS